MKENDEEDIEEVIDGAYDIDGYTIKELEVSNVTISDDASNLHRMMSDDKINDVLFDYSNQMKRKFSANNNGVIKTSVISKCVNVTQYNKGKFPFVLYKHSNIKSTLFSLQFQKD